MNVLVVDQFGELGGAQRCLLDLVPAMCASGWAVAAAVPEGPLAEALRARTIVPRPIRSAAYGMGRKSAADVIRFAAELLPLSREIAGLVRALDADLVYVNGPRVLPACALARPPAVLFHCHSYLDKRYAVRLARTALRIANATLVGSCRFVIGPLETSVPADRRHVVYNGVTGCPVSRRRYPSGGPWRVGVLGRIAPQKGQAEFVKAARLLVRDVPDCEFLICGAPMFSDQRYFDEVRNLAAGLPLRFLGWREDAAAVLSSLDLIVVPSIAAEATTRVILEAFSAGVPVVAFRTGGIPEVVEHGRTGFLVDHATPEALAEALLDLIRGDPDRLARVACHASQAWSERYTLARYQEEMLSVLRQAAAPHGRDR